MNSTIRIILAVLAGLLIGSMVNLGIVMISGMIIPPPEGANITTMEGLKESIHLFQPKHYIMPFLAHAMGTLVGSVTVVKIVIDNKMRWALLLGAIFFVGGLSNVFMLPSPVWFIILDLGLAYFPMAYLGAKWA
ncbi:hypothetical protein [Echinicola shivajiensis]|uniref:hypothetical protein n=1 Tax=Echinicola shivajiensis TaxID=1035916 RepID=UPI001BFC1F65|nr:hypothetical protein [Echinicola shivajiensis]